MPKTFTAPFAQTPRTATANVTSFVPSIATDNPANTILLLTAGSDGALVTKMTAVPRATVTSSSLLVFLSKDAGTTLRLIDSATMVAQTVSTTLNVASTVFTVVSETTPMRLEASDRLYVGSQVALPSGIIFRAEYTDF